MSRNIQIETIADRNIAIRGIGRMFYQDGIPIGVTAHELSKIDVFISWLHVADELIKEGWKPDRIVSKFKEELEDDPNPTISIEQIKKFVYSTYEYQRSMLFTYLFSDTEAAKKWLLQKLSS